MESLRKERYACGVQKKLPFSAQNVQSCESNMYKKCHFHLEMYIESVIYKNCHFELKTYTRGSFTVIIILYCRPHFA